MQLRSKYYCRLEELRTLGSVDETHQLSVIFVAPTFSEVTPRKAENRNIEIKREKYTFTDIQKAPSNIVLIGDAGSGKTTLLRKLFLSIVEQNERESETRDQFQC